MSDQDKAVDSTVCCGREKLDIEMIQGDINVIVKRCAFIRHCIDEAATLGGLQWIAATSNLALVKGADYFIHQKISQPHPKYDYVDTQMMIDDLREESEPETCEHIKKCLGFNGCPSKECPVDTPAEWLSLHGRAYNIVWTLLEKEQLKVSDLVDSEVLDAWAEIFWYDEVDFYRMAQRLLEKDPEFRVDVFAEIIKSFG